jgi:hypothetical protein
VATVLLWAGLLKVWEPGAASVSLVRFGLLRRVRPVAGRGAGAVEILAGAVLLARPFWPVSYLLPVALLVLFTGLLGRALARDEKFSCACFGAATDEIGVATLARTAALLALALTALTAVITSGSNELSPQAQLEASSTSVLALAAVSLALSIRSTRPFSD